MQRNSKPEKERRKRERRTFSYYMQFKDDLTGELVGSLEDISLGGFRLEGSKRIPLNAEVRFRVDLPAEVPGKAVIGITARNRWIVTNPIDPRLYISGYEIKHMDSADSRAFRYLFDVYASPAPAEAPSNDYVWQD
jgi:hypothetical protein